MHAGGSDMVSGTGDPRMAETATNLSGLGAGEPAAHGLVPARYYSMEDLCERFRCSSRTIFRRMKRTINPLPAPSLRHAGSFNLWDGDEVTAWEVRERARTAGATPSSDAPQVTNTGDEREGAAQAALSVSRIPVLTTRGRAVR